MRTQVISAVVIIAGFATATMVVAQPGPTAKALDTAKPESELAKLRAEIELLQLEHDVAAAHLRKLLTDVQSFDDVAAIAHAMYEAAKRDVAERKRTAKPGEEEQFTISASSLDMKFESLGRVLDEDGVQLIRPALGRKKTELLRRSIELNEKRIELARIENKFSTAK
jgi:hypothetical protein